ncbi:CinA family protein [Marinactinospora rubrisoli]|uniref:CinA family protein n=1 Tax=Marinactinospora rubrisoli TaxID=2715399 RepID=A0ABW2KK23_9ACTN
MPEIEDGGPVHRAAVDVHRALAARSATVATAESLTGGMIGAVLTSVAGASATFRGGVIAYATQAKAELLGVRPALLAEHGAVHPDVAHYMAVGARRALVATYGLAVTGVAGPEPQDGRPVGTVFVGVAGPDDQVTVRELRLAGDRAGIRGATVEEALRTLLAIVTGTTLK